MTDNVKYDFLSLTHEVGSHDRLKISMMCSTATNTVQYEANQSAMRRNSRTLPCFMQLFRAQVRILGRAKIL